jgi:FKBP-type peptidyl-prolyl cis-trans isomerase 2
MAKDEIIMKKFLVFMFVAVLLSSGCIGQQKNLNAKTINQQKTVKNGDNISVDYVGSVEDGNVFDTSIESVARQNDIYIQGRKYQTFNFIVGKGQVIKGFDEGVIGMKVGDTKTITIPPEKGYGPINPSKISTYPVIQSFPATTTIHSVLQIPVDQFKTVFGLNHSVGDIVKIPNSNTNLTVKNISITNVSLSYNLVAGNKIYQKGAPWNWTVVTMDDKNIKIRADLNKNDIVHLQDTFWNSTVIDINDTNITLRHDAIPDKEIQSMFGSMRIHFNETTITIDQNNKLAGKTLVFQVTVRSIG